MFCRKAQAGLLERNRRQHPHPAGARLKPLSSRLKVVACPREPAYPGRTIVWSRGSPSGAGALPVFQGTPAMRILPPVSIEARRLLPSRWDLLAAILVLGFIVAFADVSRFLAHPLSSVTSHTLSLDPMLLPGYALS